MKDTTTQLKKYEQERENMLTKEEMSRVNKRLDELQHEMDPERFKDFEDIARGILVEEMLGLRHGFDAFKHYRKLFALEGANKKQSH